MAKTAPKIRLVTPDKAHAAPLPAGMAGDGRAEAYLDDARDPIHLHRHCLGDGERLELGPLAADCVVYVWQGAVLAGGAMLAAGSSAIVEHGKRAAFAGAGEGEAVLLTFAASAPVSHGRAGGHVHLLPAGQVPGAAELSGSGGVGGGIHADGSCPTCEVWLHENHFAPRPEPLSAEDARRGIHSHSEAEVIFITSGAIRLGARLFPAGTAVAIAADTLYHIAPGPEGMSFVNFRAGTPSDIRFANGHTMSETQYWIDRVPRPQYIEAAGT